MELPSEFKNLTWFKFLPKGESCLSYAGEVGNGIQKIKIEQGESTCFYYVVETIHRDETDIWRSTREMMTHSIKLAEMSLFGSFELTLLAVGDLEANRTFDIQNLATVIINHARKIEAGSAICFSYAGAWLSMRKLAPLDWGKIKFQTHFQNYMQEREKLDLFVKKILKAATTEKESVFIVVRDFSRQSIFRFGEDAQTARLAKLFQKDKALLVNIKAIYYLNSQVGDQDLLEQFEVCQNVLPESDQTS